MLDEKLLQERLAQFNPEPLVEINETKTKEDIESYVNKDDENNIDLAKTNFLDVLNSEDIKKSCESIIRKYGVGTCGPRAFYGTTDVHLELEERIAEFMCMEEAIVYSYGFVAISSSIAAYCKRKDIVFVDKEANFPIQQGLTAARSNVVYFDHNDPDSFRKEAQKVAEKEKNKKPARKFLIVEGVSWKTGKVLPLEEFLRVAEEFKMRVFLEETYSVGIFGDHGRGLTEHFDIDPTRIDMIIATLESAIGSIGGFCAGSQTAIEHQRLSGSGYIFSASLPTYLVQACLESLKVMGEKPKQLRALAEEFHDFLKETCKFKVISDSQSAFKVFTVTDEDRRVETETKIWEFCKENKVHFLRNDVGLVVNLNVALRDDKQRLEKVYDVLKRAATL
ncbi:serine palmitoyltransferase 1 [Anoplophora glabripennis]|uniref:serine palmitoyltransferase 1 n=1 Tax=Anoplophora glabripennis TaxID=217634 RepID=UPI0008739321|nr:serine palmitoyltransferase 1 [Anoplophora glabripennis]